MWPKGIKDLSAFNAKEAKGASAQEREREVFFWKKTVRIDVESKVIPTSFLNIAISRALIGVGEWRKKEREE